MFSVKGWLVSAFLLVTINSYCFASPVKLDKTLREISESQLWHSLLHIKDGSPQINDPSFLISAGKTFSPYNELLETINVFKKNPQQSICRYPARYLLLKKHLAQESGFSGKIEQCSAFNKYLNHVPFDKLNLVFASELIYSSSSMMGHTFLNASGINYRDNEVSHTLSFFAEVDSPNPFSLFYDGMIGGMSGFFIVRPYRYDREKYLKEGRSLWVYDLALTKAQKDMIKYHIWELKGVDIRYLFQKYNCATLTLYILSLAEPRILEEEKLYVSPIDVVKAIQKHALSHSFSMHPSKQWLRQLYNADFAKPLKKQSDQTSKEIKVSTFSYHDFIEDLSSPTASEKLIKLTQSEHLTTLKKYNPATTKQDAAISIGLGVDHNESFLEMKFLAGSHHLRRDNSPYFSESELKLGELALRYYASSSQLKLQSLTLYSATSLTPSLIDSKALSSNIHIGLQKIKNKTFEDKLMARLSGGIGKTYLIGNSIYLFGMFNVGYITNLNVDHLFFEPEIGAVVRYGRGNKVNFRYKRPFGQFDNGFQREISTIEFAFNTSKESTLSILLEQQSNEKLTSKSAKITFDKIF